MVQKREKKTESIIVDIPVKSHVGKYLSKQLANRSLEVGLNTSIGITLYYLFRCNHVDKKFANQGYKSKYPVLFQDYFLCKNRVNNFSSYTYQKFNNIFDGELKKDCFTHVSYSCRYAGMTKKNAIEDFMNSYNLTDEDITFDALTKYITRYKQMVSSQHSMFWTNGKPSKTSSEKNINNLI